MHIFTGLFASVLSLSIYLSIYLAFFLPVVLCLYLQVRCCIVQHVAREPHLQERLEHLRSFWKACWVVVKDGFLLRDLILKGS